jgi:putative transposase
MVEPPPGAPSTSSASQASGWRSRGYLPHLDSRHAIQAITFRLNDALPKMVVDLLDQELSQGPELERAREKRRRIDKLIDAGFGSCLLRDPGAAHVVEQGLLIGDGVKYRLLAWVIMPNHVHVLIEPNPGVKLGGIVQSWKSFSARWINAHARTLGLTSRMNPVWQREYWDRFIRDQAHYQSVVDYIHANPVKAGFVDRPQAWRWSSAWGERIA